MNVADAQLRLIEYDARAFGTSAFTGFHLKFWNTDAFAAAVRAWEGSGEASQLIAVHLLADTLFLFAYPYLLYQWMRRVGVNTQLARLSALAIFVFDLFETAVAAFTLLVVKTSVGFLPGAVQFFGVGKWLAIAWVVGLIVAFYLFAGDGVSIQGTVASVTLARSGGPREPWVAMGGLTLLVAAFGLLIGLPAGGPLEQIPDVLRIQLDPPNSNFWILTFAILLIGWSAIVVALAALLIAQGAKRTPHATGWWPPILVALAITTVLFLLNGFVDGRWTRLVPFGPLIVVVGISAISLGIGAVRSANGLSTLPLPDDKADWVAQNQPIENGSSWAGALAGAVITVAAVGLIRASFAPALFGLESSGIPWVGVLVTAFALSATGGFVAWITVQKLGQRANDELVRLVALGVCLIAVVAAIAISFFPSIGPDIGTTGVVAFAVATYAGIVALLAYSGMNLSSWVAFRNAGWSTRTPWLGLIVVIWVVASFLNSEGGYHDVSLTASDGRDIPTVQASFETWKESAAECPGEGPIPLYLVAAPGGGIRAAYWTTLSLDRLFGSAGIAPCASRGPFAMSGVSGGSVGIATWLATVDKDPKAAVDAMSSDDALSKATVGLLFRDLVQPVLGLTTAWDDRAELIEESWRDSVPRFGKKKDPMSLLALGSRRNWTGMSDWQPLVLLNGSSVADGCRVILSNAVGLASAVGPDCLQAPSTGQPLMGAITGSIELAENFVEPVENCDESSEQTISAVSAALLSARFPYVTPSGAVYRCISVAGQEASQLWPTYIVDGGYFENGLYALLQMWSMVEPQVLEYNSSHSRPIQPWIIVLDNHYRSSVAPGMPGRPLELLVPLTTKLTVKTLTQPALEQAAAAAMTPLVDSEGSGPIETTFIRIAPTSRPGVAAPLGWVLSNSSREDLLRQLDEAIAQIQSFYSEFNPGTSD